MMEGDTILEKGDPHRIGSCMERLRESNWDATARRLSA